jgi:post-segregation antitoxin (ccd killing protein)
MPRPKIKQECRRKSLVITLPPMLILEAKAIAELSGISVSAMVETALSDTFKRLRKNYQNND